MTFGFDVKMAASAKVFEFKKLIPQINPNQGSFSIHFSKHYILNCSDINRHIFGVPVIKNCVVSC